MKFSESWLRTFVNPAIDTQSLCDLLTFGGIEVEAVAPLAPAFDRVVVAEVLEVEKHPNADRLNLCKVNVGDAVLSIVCGAPNVKVGIRVPAALVGAQLPEMKIKAAKVRGVDSAGMLCSARELGLDNGVDGLWILSPNATIGMNLRQALSLDDNIIDIKATPNRGDCLSLLGLAREVSALGDCALNIPFDTNPVSVKQTKPQAIEIKALEACPRYCARPIHGVNPKAPTPDWMVERLARSGVRSISAIVDVTNYVMLEMGQPLHAFDAAKIDGAIQVRWAQTGESLLLLNGETRVLDQQYLIIADQTKPLALAGIMGGQDSSVTDNTQDVVLESAFFSPDAIAGKSRKLGFGSDSSYRFERGVDFANTLEAMERASALILQIAGGVAGPVSEAIGSLPQRSDIFLRLNRVEKVLGVALSWEAVAALLKRLDFAFEKTAEGFRVTPTSYRFDMSIEEDLIEEVARVYGYENIPALSPVVAQSALPSVESNRSAQSLRRLMVSRNYQEIVTYSFVDRDWEKDFYANANPISLANPIASQMAVMRSGLIGGLVQTIAYNLNHQQSRIRVFETGRCFSADGTDYAQPWYLGAAVCGGAVDEQWGVKPPRAVDFFDMKADLEALWSPKTLRFMPEIHPALHPGKCARIYDGAKAVGWLGELHPKWQQKYELSQPVILFEFELNALSVVPIPQFKENSKFLPVVRDVALVFDESVTYQSILETVNAQKPSTITDFSLFDIYRGAGVENGKKSLAFRMLVQDTAKTLTDADVELSVSEIIKIMQHQFNAKLR